MKLYTNPASRGQIVSWYLHELGVQAEEVILDFKAGEHKAPGYTDKFPFGLVPSIEDGDLRLFESGAILLYLAERFPEASGVTTTEQRALAAQWVLFANATLAPVMFIESVRDTTLPKVFSPLDKVLADREYLEGGKFSVADLAVGAYLTYMPMFLPQVDLSPWPNVVAYINRISERPSFKATSGSPEVTNMAKEMAEKRAAAAAAKE
ncbi:glutathione S-transferase [Monoraphidium neglectum]|uniref:Glutathione S-transferase n=1 Tax=Monoraphidium neglectum TaxID=145388 RepID=A0A0D2N4M0_9CHLO|nr:glutathione S-transferase [Monoraphidium neglectum]KIZ07227.1 glutathione S-transferase [Monoraphidium neglectum]|eukprot:XP_013906246.1 glutathione S-transferase [Monoraphidium neglectum]